MAGREKDYYTGINQPHNTLLGFVTALRKQCGCTNFMWINFPYGHPGHALHAQQPEHKVIRKFRFFQCIYLRLCPSPLLWLRGQLATVMSRAQEELYQLLLLLEGSLVMRIIKILPTCLIKSPITYSLILPRLKIPSSSSYNSGPYKRDLSPIVV